MISTLASEKIELPADALPSINELPGDLRLIADVIGVEAAIKLAQVFGGTPLYITKVDRYVKRIRDRQIREEFDKRTASGGESATMVVNDMARRPGMPCSRQLWNIINAPDERQMELWG
ncbi:MAG: hypothetical protein OEY01_16440 [Desulfobulbaceae bacterium]|nr:hypothetical protein [Desulfobulbaceae bacterium]